MAERHGGGDNYRDELDPHHLKSKGKIHVKAGKDAHFEAVKTESEKGTRVEAGGNIADNAVPLHDHRTEKSKRKTVIEHKVTQEVSHHHSKGKTEFEAGEKYKAQAPDIQGKKGNDIGYQEELCVNTR